jgi:hypothetical protein
MRDGEATYFAARRTPAAGLATGLALAAALALSLAGAASAEATTRFVDEGGSGAAPCVKRSKPCDEIDTALGASSPGDRVYVGAGTYDDPIIVLGAKVMRNRRVFAAGSGPAILDNGSVNDGDEGFDAVLPGDGAVVRNLTIRSPTRPVRTIGAAKLVGNVFDQATPPAVGSMTPLCGRPLVDISNGTGVPEIIGNTFDDPLAETDADQVGVCAPPATEPRISGNTFENLVNGVRIEGGAGDADGIDPVIEGNVIVGARDGLGSGAGIFVRGSVPTITDNVIGPPANTADPADSGVAFISLVPAPTGAHLARNRIEGFGIGVNAFETDGPVTMRSDLIVGNATGVYASDLGDNGDGNITAQAVTVFDSSAYDFLLKNAELTLSSSIIGEQGIDLDDDIGASTCAISFSRGPAISGDSCEAFATTASPGFVDPASGDFHLSAGSQMIDASGENLGEGFTDIDGDPRPLDGDCPQGQLAVPDLGADELNCEPETKARGPKGLTRKRRPTYRLRSTDEGSTFQCKIDRKRFRACGKRAKLKLKPGRHRLRFRAVDPEGNVDPTPAKRRLRVLT